MLFSHRFFKLVILDGQFFYTFDLAEFICKRSKVFTSLNFILRGKVLVQRILLYSCFFLNGGLLENDAFWNLFFWYLLFLFWLYWLLIYY